MEQGYAVMCAAMPEQVSGVIAGVNSELSWDCTGRFPAAKYTQPGMGLVVEPCASCAGWWSFWWTQWAITATGLATGDYLMLAVKTPVTLGLFELPAREFVFAAGVGVFTLPVMHPQWATLELQLFTKAIFKVAGVAIG